MFFENKDETINFIFMTKKLNLLTVALYLALPVFAQKYPYQNKKLAVEKRVADLLARMTDEEKFWQVFMVPGDLDNAKPGDYKHGIFGLQVSAGAKGDAAGQLLSYNTTEDARAVARKINAIQKFFVEDTRLGIPIIAFDEALHGLVRKGATAFPQSIGMAATWDTALVHRAANQIALETQQRGIRDILSPVVNLATDVRWGRTEETYGEDPFLTTQMGLAFITAFEQKNIITTPKHFVANVADGGRDSYPVYLSDWFLDQSHFVPFKTLVQKGGARSIMTAYNSVNGTAASSNSWLLQQKLKKEWGFKGFVISDANAVGGELVLHNTAKDYAQSGAHAVNNGLDVIFQTEYEHYKLFQPPFLNKQIDTARLNDAVARVLRAKFELGLFENPYVPEEFDQQTVLEQSREVAKEVAVSSLVLLKNDNVLPFSKAIKSIAVVGADATEARLGGYSGPGNNKISILDGIKSRAGKSINVQYALGANRNDVDYTIVPDSCLSFNGKPGLQGSYFNGLDLAKKPFKTRIDSKLDFHWTLFGPMPELKPDFYAVSWEGELTSPKTGTYQLGLEGNDGYRLFVNGKLIVDRWNKQSYHATLVPFNFEKDKTYDVKVEFYEPQGEGKIRLIWDVLQPFDWKTEIEKAIAMASKSDVAVAMVGINEGEFNDRAMLRLPGHQEELINALAKTGKPVVVLLVGGSAITMNNWSQNASAIMSVWYPGEAGGEAIAKTLFGDYNPSGKLPITFPIDESQLPLIYNHQPTGRGNNYNNLTGQPLYPFGYGLSYTTFGYSNMVIGKNNIKNTDSTFVTFRVKNTGTMAGDEVCQLYIRDVLSSVTQPVLALKGFQRVKLAPGQEKELRFAITPAMLSLLNQNKQTVVEPGDFNIMIGSSSKDLRLKDVLTVKP